jgi:hypothetical protein
MRYSNGYSNFSSDIGVYPIEPSKSNSSWMMTALTCSRRNFFTRNILSPMTMAEVSSGLVNLESKHQPLLSQHHSLQPSKINLPTLNHPPNHTPQKLNAVNSR